MSKYTLYAKKVYYYRKEITAQDRKSAEERGRQYESKDNAERLFEPTVEEFYITSIEESDDAV
jgi:hypothetical protein